MAFNAAVAALLDSSFPMIRMAFASSCLLDPQGNLLMDPDASEESSPFISEHFAVYDPSDLKKSLAFNHFGKFSLEDAAKVSSVLIEEGILPVAEEVQAVLRKKIENF